MAQKHLHELLKEDQEPFILTNFIADKRSLLRRRPISHSSVFARKLCRSACFSSSGDSPVLRTPSPLLEFHSPAKSPRRKPNAVFLHVPARTAGLLLEAALRIQKQSTATAARSKSHVKSNGFGLLGSFLKRFTFRRRSRRREIDGGCPVNVPGGGPPLPAVNENDSVSRQSNFCDSPFRFVLQSSPSAGHRTPEFSSPATSPARHDHQVNGVECLEKLPAEDEEEEKEQNSPVSVLDPPFEDDDEGHYDNGKDEDDYDLERSYAIVQKAKHQLLKKLRRFERLAELDPVELETFLLRDEEDELDDDDIDHLQEEDHEHESRNFDLSNNKKNTKSSSSFKIPHQTEKDTKRLGCNLIMDEERDLVVHDEGEEMRKIVYMRPDLWKRVDSSAIDAMAGQDMKADQVSGWNRNGEQRGEIAIEIEVAIFSLLVEEMETELHCIIH